MKSNVQFKILFSICMLFSSIGDNANNVAMAQDHSTEKPQTESVETDDTPVDSVSPLITADELKKLIAMDDPKIKVLEPGKTPVDFSNGHPPRAQFVHWVNDMTDSDNLERYNNPKAAQFAELMSKLGIQNDDRIIIYDRMDSRLSTRLFWTLKYYGHKQVQVLDGGFAAWKSKSFMLTRDSLKIFQSKYSVATMQEELLAEMEYVESQLEDPNTMLIDGRPPAQFSGEQPGRVFHTDKAHPRKGHIPGAVNVFWKDNFNADGTFKSAEELRSLYENANIKPSNNVITYCNEGLHAAPPWFVLTQLLDYKNVRLYDSSMAEWAKSKHPLKIEDAADSKVESNSDK